MKDNEEHLLICNCESCEHQMIISYDHDENMAYVYIHLNHLGFWRRVCNAIEYIFGKKSKYGDFDNFILRSRDADKLISIGNKLKDKKYGIYKDFLNEKEK